MTQFDRWEKQLEQDLAEGNISQDDFNKQYRELERDARDEEIGRAEEAAERAYNDALGGW